MYNMKRQKGMTPEEPARSGVQYSTGEELRTITNSFRKNEEDGPKWKHSAVNVSRVKVKFDAVKSIA